MDKLFLGVSREIITPKIGCQLYGYRPDVFSESINDDLTATAFYFKQGNIQALLISITVCLINSELSQKISNLIEKEFGISKKAIMLCATHTHSAPNVCGESGWGDIDKEYCEEIFIPNILKTVKTAISNTQAVKMGVMTDESLVGINRREIRETDGELKAHLGQNPNGPFNPRMTVISFENENRKNVANIIHYGAHCTAAGRNHEITRDWAGLMIDALEKEKGGITAFLNGPEGDVGPRLSNGETTGNINYVYELGKIAAKDALNIGKKITDYFESELSVSNKTLKLPLKKRISLGAANALYEEHKECERNLGYMIKTHAKKVIESYNLNYQDEKHYNIEQTVISLGDVVFVSFPFELFSEIGIEIDKKFEKKKILSLSNTNGSEGYFITDDAFQYGGYETDMFLYGRLQQFCDNAFLNLIDETVNHLKERG